MVYPDKRIESAQTREFPRKDKTTCAVVTNMMAWMGTRAHVMSLRSDGAAFCLCRATYMLNARWNWDKTEAVDVLSILIHDDAGVDHIENRNGQRIVHLNTDPLVITAKDAKGKEYPCAVCIRCENALFALAGVKHEYHHGNMFGTAAERRGEAQWEEEEAAREAAMEEWERRAQTDREAWDNMEADGQGARNMSDWDYITASLMATFQAVMDGTAHLLAVCDAKERKDLSPEERADWAEIREITTAARRQSEADIVTMRRRRQSNQRDM